MDKPVKEGEPTKLTPKSIDGRFRIVREIGRGAAGMVYEGVQMSVDRRVAIKVLHSDHQANKDYIERFAREAKAIARLSHTNCITLFDFGYSEEFRSHYMVTEYIEGKELFEIMLDGQLPFRIALRIAIQISEAIAHAHKHGILHRDLKPENVLVTPDWEAKVLDFGLARLLDMFGPADAGGRRLTAQGAVFGTPAYMSPEQCAGDIDVTVRSDIYSLGVMLYELFEGRLPFDSKDVVKILVMHAKDPPPPMQVPIPQEVKTLVMQMLEKDPKARPRTGLQVADQLRAVLITMAADLGSPGADISQEIQRTLLRGIERTDQTGEGIRVTEDGLEKMLGAPRMDARSPRLDTLDLVGHKLGNYTVGQLIGEGAMSSVFRGTRPDGEEVAVKVVAHAVPESFRASERFHKEVEALGRLFDPTIVTLLDSGYEKDVDRLYLVTELVPGDDLATLCAHGRTPTELALRVAQDSLRALAAAHDQGVIHRDMKPSNIMVVPQSDGRVRAKVLDFGLARLVGDQTRLTAAGGAPGTARYMSPEQLRGEDATPQSDLFSLGVVLYEMLSGHSPFEAKAHNDIVKAVMQHNPPRLDTFVQEVPKPFADFVANLMQKKPAHRPQSAKTAFEILRGMREELPIREMQVNHRGRASEPQGAWRLRRKVVPPSDAPPQQPRSTGVNKAIEAPRKDSEGPLDWQPSSSRGWLAAIVAILVIVAVVAAFVVFGGGGI